MSGFFSDKSQNLIISVTKYWVGAFFSVTLKSREDVFARENGTAAAHSGGKNYDRKIISPDLINQLMRFMLILPCFSDKALSGKPKISTNVHMGEKREFPTRKYPHFLKTSKLCQN